MSNELPKIAIIGYGTMGKEIEKAAKKDGFEICATFDIDNPLSISSNCDFDVAIDFSTASAVYDNVRTLAAHGKNVVIGATGWYEMMPLIQDIVAQNNIGLLWASNFSIGMNIFMKITQVAAKLINLAPGYDAYISEAHHRRKRDCPSGSALTLGEIILKEFKSKDNFVFGNPEGVISPDSLQITSVRAGDELGRHTVMLDSPIDSIELTHSAKSREGFAAGALLAATWLHKKQGFYKFDDILEQIWFADK